MGSGLMWRNILTIVSNIFSKKEEKNEDFLDFIS